MKWPHWFTCSYELHKSIPDKKWEDILDGSWREKRRVRELYVCPVCEKRWENIKYEKRDKPSIFDSRWEKYGEDY